MKAKAKTKTADRGKSSKVVSGSVLAGVTLAGFVAYRRWKREVDESAQLGDAAGLKKVGLSREVYMSLPRLSHAASGKPMEWMNLVLVGERPAIEKTLAAAGWCLADPVTPWTLLRALIAIVRRHQYLNGPMTPLFVGERPQAFGYQKGTSANSFHERHHARFWPTGRTDTKDRSVWIAHASFDNAMKASGPLRLPTAHSIDPDLDAEREVLVRDLLGAGALLRGYVQLQPAGEGTNAFGDAYYSDGRAAVMEITT